MDKKWIEKQKLKLLELKSQILNNGFLQSKEDLTISSDDLADETDLATSVINQQVTFNIRHRELHKLREIEAALQRIEDGLYGVCEETGEPIEAKRLEKQPWARLSIAAAEEQEREMGYFRREG